jgi:hypothetical protein
MFPVELTWRWECRNMVGTVTIEGDQVVFELHGADRFLAMKKRIAVPLNHIKSVSTENVSWGPFSHKSTRRGSQMPGVVKDGSFRTSDGLIFFEMHHPDKCVTVTLEGEEYQKIIFEVDDKETTAELIKAAIGERPF